MVNRFYIGLATTFHDPAIAIVGPDGSPVFAEATERYLQYKRALNCEPDSTLRMTDLLRAHVPADAEVVVATTWGQQFSSYLQRSADTSRLDVPSIAALGGDITGALGPASRDRAFLAALDLQQRHAGLGTTIGMERAFGRARIADLRRYAHHRTHAAFAALGSPFDEAACLVVDGMGEAGSVSLFHYRDGQLGECRGRFGTVSPGLLYGLLTDLAGFDSLAGEEWKVMGLAPYGQHDPKLAGLVRQLYRIDDRGRPVRTTAEQAANTVTALLAHRPADVDDGWPDLACASQEVFSELITYYLAEAHRVIPSPNLVLTGGCALNSAFNGTIVGRSAFDALHVPSAPADDGNALGAALLAWADDNPGRRPAAVQPLTAYLGSESGIPAALERQRQHDSRLCRIGDKVVMQAARLLAAGRVVGWMQGRAEFGPRALGNRSILADPRRRETKEVLNAKVKYREPFRPFAPSILASRGHEWFEDFQQSPYMERTLSWRPSVRARVPAVVHVDGTGRLQTVTEEGNARFHDLLTAFERLTGVPVLLNTSLNVMGKPIAHSPADAFALFYTTGLDALVVDDWLIAKPDVDLPEDDGRG